MKTSQECVKGLESEFLAKIIKPGQMLLQNWFFDLKPKIQLNYSAFVQCQCFILEAMTSCNFLVAQFLAFPMIFFIFVDILFFLQTNLTVLLEYRGSATDTREAT